MEGYALITGATSGIGLELALNFARDSINLVLVARNSEKLEEMKKRLVEDYGVKVFTLAKDLTKDEASKEIFEALDNEGIQVEYLVNNAGFGTFGRLKDTDLDTEKDLVKLNEQEVCTSHG
jgi:short-subunit dehydrogenase